MKTALATKPTTRRSNQRDFAYLLKDVTFGELKVQNSANAWWTDKGKLERLVTAFKYDGTIKEACLLAGISIDQYRYFIELHPEFSPIIEACRQVPVLIARKTIVDNLHKDPATARWYLQKKAPGEFGSKVEERNAIEDMRQKIEETRREYST